MMKIKCTKEIKMMTYSGAPESLSQEGLNNFHNTKWVSIESLEEWIDSVHDGLFTDRNWKKALKQQLKVITN